MKKFFTGIGILLLLLLVGCEQNLAKKKYKIKYFAADQELSLEPNSYSFTEELTLPEYQQPGFYFAGWYEEQDFSGEKVITIAKGNSEDKIFYARLLKLYQLDLEFNGGEEVAYQSSFHVEEELLLPTNIFKEGYSFIGWYDNTDFAGEPVEKIPLGSENDLTYYAHFEKMSTQLSLEFNGGTEIDYQKTIYYDEELILPEEISRENYLFAGWYENQDFSSERIFKIPKQTSDDVALFAKWEIDPTFLDNAMEEYTSTKITKDLVLPTFLSGFVIRFTSSDENIITDKGVFNQPYQSVDVILSALITDGTNTLNKDYLIKPVFYKSLEAPIRSGYIYRSYHLVDDFFFESHDIIYTAFAKADLNGIVRGEGAFFSNVKGHILPKAKEHGNWVIMSVGPSSDWSSFSATAELRKSFANSIVDVINEYGFDGVDIDWEYPKGTTEMNNYPKLMQEVYTKVKQNNPNHLVTTAITGGMWQPNYYKLEISNQYFDYLNMMTYGMVSAGGQYHTALYPNRSFDNPLARAGRTLTSCSIDESITIFNNLGVPTNKIIAGAAFYGIKQIRSYNAETGVYGDWISAGVSPAYHTILNLLKRPTNYVEHYDEVAEEPYLLSKDNTEFISYDNPRSIKAKAAYIIENGLAGMMYWEYHHDNTGALIEAMVEGLPKD